jgi:hypothetical protein
MVRSRCPIDDKRDIGGVLDGVGGDDLFVVILGVGVAEFPLEKGLDVEFFGNVDAVSLDFLEDTNPGFPVAIGLEFHIGNFPVK